eukprot:91329-Prymnesium_polylepis.1
MRLRVQPGMFRPTNSANTPSDTSSLALKAVWHHRRQPAAPRVGKRRCSRCGRVAWAESPVAAGDHAVLRTTRESGWS